MDLESAPGMLEQMKLCSKKKSKSGREWNQSQNY